MSIREIVILVVAYILGVITEKVICRFKKPAGVLKIDKTNPEKDTYQFIMDNIDELEAKRISIDVIINK